YRLGSAYAYDPTAFREAAESIFRIDDEAGVRAIYMPANFYDAGAKWRFYTRKYDRPMLWLQTKYYDGVAALATAPVDSIAVLPATHGATLDGWDTIAIVKNLTDEPTVIIIRRRR